MTNKLSRRSVIAGSAAAVAVIPTVGLGQDADVVEVKADLNRDCNYWIHDLCVALDDAWAQVGKKHGYGDNFIARPECFIRITSRKK